eukprot:1143796-Pelagomonas_calceolata.AAC.5
MTEKPIFVHAPRPTARFVVETDASSIATDVVIYQSPMAKNYVFVVQSIAYSSHEPQPTAALYPPHEREILAVFTALKGQKHYLLGRSFDLYSNNEAVKTTWHLMHLAGV